MKRTMRPILSLLLAVLVLAALPVSAFAMDLSLTVGQAHETCIEQVAESGYITGVSITSGSCPGMSLVVNSEGNAAYFRGTPTTAGDYTVSVSVSHASGDPYTTTLNVHVAEAAPEPTPTPTPTPAPTATPAPTEEVPVEPSATPAQEIVVDETPAPKLVITKDPTSENNKVEGESALFIAHADGDTEIVWLLISADGKTTYRCSEAASHFPGLRVSGLGTDNLVLSNLPLSISGWSVQAMFNGEGGPLYTKKASITVKRAAMNAPSILTQPKGADANGASVTLRVLATTEEGELRYQWYKNSSNSTTGGQAIVGATTSSYTPSESDGVSYYYVTVWAVSGDRSSPSVTSNAVTVNFTAPTPTPEPTPEPTPTPTAEPTPEPTAEVPEETGAPAETAEPTPVPEAPARRGSPALVVAAVLLLLGAAGSVGAYFYLRRRDRLNGEDEDYDEEE